MANTIGWGKGTQNNTNGWGKYQNTIDAGSVYADSYAGETVLVGTSAAFSYSKSSFHQGEADPTPTITGSTGGTFSATPSGLSINTSTGTIDLDNSTIQPYTITYTVDGVSANFSLSVTASPFISNTFSMEFDSASSQYIDFGNNVFFNTNNAFSFSAWINLDAYTTNYPYIANLKTNVTDGFAIFLSNTGAYTGINIGSTDSSITKGKTTGDISSTFLTSWNHIAVIYNGSGANTLSNYSIYVNGSPVTLTTTGAFSTITNVNNLGRLGSGSFYFDGKLDEVAIWNTALSSDAVTEIYNATNNNTGKALDLNTDTGNYTSSSNLQYWNRLGD